MVVKALPELLWAFVLVAMVLGVRAVWLRVRAASSRDQAADPPLTWLSEGELRDLRQLLAGDEGAVAIVDAVLAPRARLLRDDEIERLTAALDAGTPPDMDAPEWFVADDLMAAIQPLSERFWR